MKRKFCLFSLLLLCGASLAWGRDILINRNDGTQLRIELSVVDSLTYPPGQPARLCVHYKDGSADTVLLSVIESILYPKAAIPAPGATTQAATDVGQSAATLNGAVNPNNGGATTVSFEWELTAAYGNTLAATQSPLADGAASQPVSAPLTGLTANTTYHYRVLAANAGGNATGVDMTFSTTALSAPMANSSPPTNIQQTSVTLNGVVNTNNGGATTVTFEWGTTPAYGNTIAANESPMADGTMGPITANLSGLTANTNYNYRVVATNAGGTAYGANINFMTAPAMKAPALQTESHKSAEEVD